MNFLLIVVTALMFFVSTHAFVNPKSKSHTSSSHFPLSLSSLSMVTSSKFDPALFPGVCGPTGYFDPLNLAPTDMTTFKKYREAELKHCRVAMLACLGFLFQESSFVKFFVVGLPVSGPAIFNYQEAEYILPVLTANVWGFALAVEGFTVVRGWKITLDEKDGTGWQSPLKDTYTPGDLNFDPLGLMPVDSVQKKTMQTMELNNGRLAMIAIAGRYTIYVYTI